MEPDMDDVPEDAPFEEAPPSRVGRSVRAAGRASKSTGRAVSRGSSAAFRQARKFTHAEGAGESGLARVFELHAFNAAGDAALAISLAGTLFFTVPTDEAASQVALFLVLTMLPFAFIAPLIGPFLDRFRRGRRWAIGSTFAIRAFCAWVLAGSVADESPSFFAAALACLVASKAYGVTRAAAVPRLLPPDFSLVKANSRVSLTGTAAAAISAPLAVGAATIGANWSLRYAFVLYVVGTVLAILLPARVDSSEGEQTVELTRTDDGRLGVSEHVVNALRSNAGVRLMTGFLTIFMAFVLREPPESMGWAGNATVLMAMVIGGAGVGNTIGIVLGNWARKWKPERIVVGVLIAATLALATVAVFFTWWTAVALGVSAGLCQSLGKLSLDALIQRDVAEEVRTSAFGRSETVLQLSWVVGGLIGIGLYMLETQAHVGLLLTSVLLLGWAALVLTKAGRPTVSAVPTPER